jgi:hypothetical protein
VEVALGREWDPDASGLVAVVGAGMWAAWTASDYPASWPEQYQDVEGAEDVDLGMVVDSLPEAEDAASAPALPLGGCKKAGSAHRRKSAVEEVLEYVVGVQVGRDSSLYGEDVAEGVVGAAEGAALDVVKFERMDVISQEAAERDLVGNVASRHLA